MLLEALSLSLSLSLLLGLAGSIEFATASPISYSITFTAPNLGGGPIPTSGSFIYDAAGSGKFSNFVVVWQGITFDLTAPANAPFALGNCVSSPSNAFALLNNTLGCIDPPAWVTDTGNPANGIADFVFFGSGQGFANQFGFASSVPIGRQPPPSAGGFFTISPSVAASPEPTTTTLALVGGATLLAWQRRRRNLTRKARGVED